MHVFVDDATRLAYAEVLPDEKTKTVIGFLRRAVGFGLDPIPALTPVMKPVLS